MLVLDTGPLVALADRRDRDHAAGLELLGGEPGPLITTGLVIAEAAYLIQRQVGVDGELALYEDIAAGQFRVEELTIEDWRRVRQPADQYRDLPLGGTDASVVALAERYRTIRIPTLDRRHFHVVRAAHGEAFDLVP